MKFARILPSALVAISLVSTAHASTTITFTRTTSDPNSTGTANTGSFGSDANVSVGYSAGSFNYGYYYGTLGGGTGDGVYSYYGGNETLTMTFIAAPGYTVTLNNFDLAGYDGYNSVIKYDGYYANYYATDITVTGGATTYTNDGSYPSGDTFSTYSPDETGKSLTLTVTDLYYLGINDITYTETKLPVSATPEPSSLIFGLTGVSSLVAAGLRRRRASR